jgi:hypothetical protein
MASAFGVMLTEAEEAEFLRVRHKSPAISTRSTVGSPRWLKFKPTGFGLLWWARGPPVALLF